jgi:hypothetical protein
MMKSTHYYNHDGLLSLSLLVTLISGAVHLKWVPLMLMQSEPLREGRDIILGTN